jgi:hypothetical protein
MIDVLTFLDSSVNARRRAQASVTGGGQKTFTFLRITTSHRQKEKNLKKRWTIRQGQQQSNTSPNVIQDERK